MKLLVLAQTPPPLHGQSTMVKTLVAGLPAHGIPVHHVNLALSRSVADIGRWRPGKVFAVLAACVRAVSARFRHGCDTLYYVPAPGKRGAFWRDCVVMLLCRPCFPRLVLHWHAAGLAAWLATQATAPERGLARLLLGRADLSLVLAPSLRADADALAPRRVAVVPNGIANPGEPRPRPATPPFQVLFLGLGSEEKGLFAALEAVLAANRAAGTDRFVFAAAGAFPGPAEAIRFEDYRRANPTVIRRHYGPVDGIVKATLFDLSHCFCLPTRYPAEGQPLVLLEAMAHDLPIVATRWAAIPDTVPPGTALVAPGDANALADALVHVHAQPPPAGAQRAHFLAHYTIERHLQRLAEALTSVTAASNAASGSPASVK